MKRVKTSTVHSARFNVRASAGRKWLLARESGANVCHLLEQRARTFTTDVNLVVDFGGVEAITFSFADEFIGRYLALRVGGLVPDSGVVLDGLGPDPLEEIEAVMRYRELVIVCRTESGPRLLNADEHLRDSYDVALLLGTFSASEFAEQLDISPQNANNRLKRLHSCGAVNRSRARVERGGKEFVYDVVR
jgi:hypothetical protein